jgi:hypothetical protein
VLAFVFAASEPAELGRTGEVGELEFSDWTEPILAFRVSCRWRNFGAGKLDFLSIASTVLWKRRNRASARIRVDSRSIVVDSSLTSFC